MAYKFSKGARGFGDISFEDDADAGIDFEPDTVKIETGGQERLNVANTKATFKFLNNSNKVTLKGNTTNTAVLEDATFSGLGSADFTVSFWWYANDTNSDPINSNSRILYYEGNSIRHHLNLKTPDIEIRHENNAGGYDDAVYDTNLVEETWYHIIAHFDVGSLANGNPRLWLNGNEIQGSGYTAPGGTTPAIEKLKVYLDDGGAMQDLVFWNKLLTNDEISELYNSGEYRQPSDHSAVGNIVSWFMLGEEPLWNSAGYSAGDSIGGTVTIPDTIGSNEFTMTTESEFQLFSRAVNEISRDPALDIDSYSVRIRNSNTPLAANDPGLKGEICWDSNYIYICVATDTWKRVALSTW